MDGSEHDVARRTVLMSAGLVGAGLVAGVSQAQAEGAAAAGEAEIWSREYWAQKGDVKLNLWRKRVGAPKAGEKPLPVLFPGARLVEFDALSLRPARAGQGRILVHERHGALRLRRLDHGPRRLWPFRQLRQQFRHRQRRRGSQGRDPGGDEGDRQQKMHLYGTSSGAIRAGAYAQAQPERVDRLVLAAFTYKGTGSPEIARRADAGRRAARQPAPQARRRHDPLDLHPRRPCLGATIRRCRRRSSPRR